MKVRVVVADDFPLVREGIARALDADFGIEVIGEAADGNQALQLAETLRPDVLILDLRMPDVDGMAVLDELRMSMPEIRVLVMTACEQAGTMLDAIAAGAAGYLSKRSSGEELRRAVISVHAGGSVITPSLAGHLLKELSSSARGESSSIRPLQGRELEVLRLLAQGNTDNEIAGALYISPRTVQNHLTRIREKTGLRRRSELTRWAVQHAIG